MGVATVYRVLNTASS
ncbi:hypothetical protein [Acinetobacter sp. YH12154]